MPYTKPFTYVTDFSAAEQRSNDDAARKYVNQEIVAADLSFNEYDYDSFQRGELCPINNHHTFVTGQAFGSFHDSSVIDRSFFTSLVKANSQIDSIQYQDVYGTGDQFTLEATGTIFYTLGCTTYCAERLGPGPGAFSAPGPGQYPSTLMVRLRDESDGSYIMLAPTLSYGFEESATTALSLDPGDGGVNVRRWIGFQYMVQLSAGTYSICAAINPRVEEGFVAARSYTLELFI